MNRNKLLLIALIFTLGIFSSLFAQVDITIGDGSSTNAVTSAPSPYGTWYKNFHQQYLYRVGDIEEAGGGAGPINSLAFNVASVNNCSPMPNFTISLKTTTQTELTTNFEEGEYTQVFYQNDFMPIDGMNVHTFIAPFVWDGASNIIVDIITDLIPGSYTQNASVYYTVTDVNTSLRYQNDSLPASGSTTGSTSTSRANITFNMSAVQVTDPPNPALLVGPEDGSTLSSPLVTLNWTSGGGIPHGYKLYFGSSADPAYVGDLEAATTYTPTGLEFDTTYYWKVIPYNTAGDAVNCPVWSFTTMPSPVISTFPWIVDFGTETTDWPVPNWSQRGGLYPEASETSTQWYRDDWLNISGASNNAAKTNIYGTIRKGWLITPPLDIPGNDYELKFDLALTDYANSNPIEDPTAQLDDKFIVAISDNPDMSNPTLLREWNNSGSEFVYNQIPHTGMEITLFLTGMSGIKYIAFYGESTESGGDNDLFVDNVQVRQTPSTPLFTVTPSEYDFGQLLLGTSATKQFRVTNSGVGELIISSINLPANDNFTLANMPALPVVLNVGESVVFDAVYTPVAEGAHTANISITDNLARVVHNVPLSGSGFDATIYTLPYAQTWDEVETPNLPLGWSSYVEATTTYAVVSTSTSSPNSTPNCVYMYNSSDADAQLMLISPPFDSAIAMNSIRAYIMAKGGTGYTMQVGTMSNPSNPESFSLIEEITVPSGWNQYVVNLTGHTPAGQFIAIKHDVGSTYHSLYIDDVSFELIAPNDLAALSVSGETMIPANTPATFAVSVYNNGTATQNAYEVKLFDVYHTELASVAGPTIDPGATIDVNLTWTPTVEGLSGIYGKVLLAGDVNPANDVSPSLNIFVSSADLFTVEIGTGTDTNTNTGVPTPYGTFYKNFRQQYLYTADEIYAAGGVPGLINALAFNVADVGGCSPMPNYRIRVKHTTQEELTTTFEEGEYTQVFHADEFLPTNEWNVHTFSTPFFWNGGDNLIVDILTDLIPGTYTRNALVYYTPTSFSSALRYQNDSSPADAATTGTLYSNRSNIRFFLLVDDMGSLSGTVTENGVPLANVHIQVEDTVFSTTSGANGVYTLPHVPVGTQTVTATKHGFTPVSHTVTIALDQQTVQDFEMVGTPEISISPNSWNFGDVNLGGSANKEFSIANAGGGLLEITDISISGSTTFALGNLPGLPASLGSEQELNFTVTFTPNAMGETNAEIIITDNLATRHVFSLNQQVTPAKSSIDSRSTRNENRTVHTIQLNGYGVNELTIGTGEEEGYYPINFYYKNSLFETIYTAEEMNNFIGMITGIKFYTNFNTELMDKPVKIWLGSTALTNLSAGWIPSTDLTLVFDGNVSYPAGESIVSYTFPEPYMHLDGGNLVMLVQRPMDTGWVSGKYFKIQTVGTDRSLNIQNDSVELDPANPSDGTLSGNFPKTTFSIIPGGVGHVTGTVIDENAAPLPGVQVLINGRNSRAVTDENGQFYIANILPGDYVVSFSRYGYIDQDINIVLEEDETEVLDVTMQPMPKVIVSGTVLASDTGVGIAGANIQLEGYADYAFTTNASGVFQSEAEVYANFTYEYQIAAAGYVSTSGSIEVGDTDYSMGDIVLAEIAYAPTEVTASLNDSFDGIDIEWSAPDPNAIEITQSFEDATFPPSGWSQLITNNSPANSHGVRPTWGRLGTINDGIPAVPTDGTYQAGLCWIMEHQDEWLITNSFNCPPDAYLSFDTYLEMGSPNGDHYYVKASIDGGVTWTELWDGAAQTAANNYYTTPIHIDLVSFNGQHIKLAFHADDPPDELGLWKNWYIDNIYIGNYMEAKQITNLDIVSDTGKTKSAEIKPERSTPILHSEANMRTESRALVGYKIWRLLAGQEQSEETWIALNDEATSNTSYTDDNWNELENGTYRWAVKSVYTSDVMSSAAFSNSIIKDAQMGNIVGFVRGADNAPLAGATVSAGTGQSTTTNSSGYYILSLSAGSYTLTATATDYHPLSYDNIPVIANQNTTRNFQLVHTSNNDEMVPVTVTALNGNYPNPFNPETTISYDLKEAAPVQLDIFNLKGQLVRTLVNENQAAGRYRIVFDAKDFRGNRLSSGVYFYRMRTGSYINTRKMLLME